MCDIDVIRLIFHSKPVHQIIGERKQFMHRNKIYRDAINTARSTIADLLLFCEANFIIISSHIHNKRFFQRLAVIYKK